MYRNVEISTRSAGANAATAKEYFQKAIHHGKSIESYQRLAHIYREESNYTKSIEMLESTLA